MNMLMLMIGGFLGAVVRFFILQKFEGKASFVTVIVNTSGAFVIALCTGLAVNTPMYLLFGIGFSGAYTTFSTMSKEFFEMLKNRNYAESIIYLSVIYGCGFLLTAFGIYLGTLIQQL